MSPEQVLGEPLDQRSDLYSLGCVFYYLLTRRYPFQDNLPYAHVDQTVDAVTKLRPEIPSAVTKIVHRLLEKDVRNRFQSADDVFKTLTDILNQPKNKRSIRFIVALSLLILVSAAGILWPIIRSSMPESRPDNSRSPLSEGRSVADGHLQRQPAGFDSPSNLPIPPSQNSQSGSQVHLISWTVELFRVTETHSPLVHLGSIRNSTTPPRQNDRVIVKGEFDRAVYAYLIAINPDGSLQLLFPDGEHDTQSPTKEFVCPPESTQYLTLDQPGLQGFALIATNKALSTFPHWLPQFDGSTWQAIKTDLAWSFDGERIQPLNPERVGFAHHGPRTFGDLCTSLMNVPGVAITRAVAIPIARD
jgi:serine/threonine protein kinase